MSKLSPLRSRISALRRRRMSVRHGAGYAAIAVAVLWILVAAFLLDWSFGFSKWQRGLLLTVCGIAAVWCFRRYALPWFQVDESDLDVALMVERKQKIDSDLVAAIQFESPDASQWGSTQLEGAVIDYVADFSRNWNIFEGFSAKDLSKRGAWLVGTVLLIGVAAICRPDFFGAFLNRMFLGNAHYPTRTQIESVTLNGKAIDLSLGDAVVVKFPYGQPLKVAVKGGGELPERGKIAFQATGDGADANIELARSKDAADAHYAGELPKLVDSVYTEIYLGDAWTDPMLVQMVALPVVDTKLTPVPPPYARGYEEDDAVAPGSRMLAVIEGSSVQLEVKCANKPLASAMLKIENKTYPLEKAAGERPDEFVWKLDNKDSPLRRVTKPLRYEVLAVDEDGLAPESPVTGSIRIKADNRPRIMGDVVTRFVLPTGTPKIEYRASDDFGIKELSLQVEVLRGDKSGSAMPVDVVTRTMKSVPKGKWIAREAMPVREAYELDLSALSLQKDDQVRLTLQVSDYRGEGEGQVAQSEPIVLEVTDESGILAAISESDERSARQLDAIIERQLGVGGTR